MQLVTNEKLEAFTKVLMLLLLYFEIANEPPPDDPCRPRDQSLYGLAMSYRPTPASLMSSGGEDGYSGSSSSFKCDEANAAPCGHRNMRW